MEFKDDRSVKLGQVVQVYVNLNQIKKKSNTGGGCIFSVKDKKSGKVIGYSPTVLLKDVVFRVKPSGVKRVRKRQVREVVAVVEGSFVAAGLEKKPSHLEKEINFCPYTYDYFFNVENTSEQVWESTEGLCKDKRVFVPQEEQLKIC